MNQVFHIRPRGVVVSFVAVVELVVKGLSEVVSEMPIKKIYQKLVFHNLTLAWMHDASLTSTAC